MESKISCEMCDISWPVAMAFAGLLADGSVVTWGKREFGGDSKLVEASLRQVIQIEASSSGLRGEIV